MSFFIISVFSCYFQLFFINFIYFLIFFTYSQVFSYIFNYFVLFSINLKYFSLYSFFFYFFSFFLKFFQTFSNGLYRFFNLFDLIFTSRRLKIVESVLRTSRDLGPDSRYLFLFSYFYLYISQSMSSECLFFILPNIAGCYTPRRLISVEVTKPQTRRFVFFCLVFKILFYNILFHLFIFS